MHLNGLPAAGLEPAGLDASHAQHWIGPRAEHLEDAAPAWGIKDVVRAPLTQSFVPNTGALNDAAVRTERAFWRHRLVGLTWLAFFCGVCVAMIVYSLAVYFSFRHRSYLYYVLFAASVVGWSLCTEGFARQSTNPTLANLAAHAFGLSAMLSFISFARAFLDSKIYTPRLDLPIRVLQVAFVTALPLPYFGIALFVQVLLFLGVPVLALLFAVSVQRWRQRALAARLFALACAPFALGLCLWGIDSVWPMLGSSWVAGHAFQIGALISLVLLPTTLFGRLALSEQLQQRTAELRERTRELTESQHALAVARDQALSASRAKSTFLAAMSHELRTPLNAIIGYSEMLQEDTAEAGLTEYKPDLEKIVFSGKHLLGLINDILDLSRIEAAGKVELFAEDFEVGELTRAVAATVKTLVEKNGNRLEVAVASDVGTMHSDPTRLRQILFNLLSNAAKFTRQGTVRLAVARQSVAGAEWLEFAVSDTGIGMAEEQLGKIFDAFSQAKAWMTREHGGTGLGLTITKLFSEMLGGNIEVTSEPGRGSRFVVRLPARMPGSEVAEVEIRAEGPPPAEGASSPAPRAGTGQQLVLVIEDDASARALLQRALEHEGYAVQPASNGEEGLRLARACRPDAITLRVMMPRMEGWSVLAALKAERELADVPVIVITIVENRDLGFALGAAEYLLKPVERERLVEVLARLVPPAGDGPVLVVDDEEAVRQRLARAVQSAGYRTVEAANGREALAELEKQRPRLILLDLVMPEMDGFEVLAALRQRNGWGEVPVVVVTSKELTAAERASLSRTTERVFQKGAYDAASLVAEVNHLIATRHAA